MPDNIHYELCCPSCSWAEQCSYKEILTRLRSSGSLRRDAEPDQAVVIELFNALIAKMSCPECGGRPLSIGEVNDDDEFDWDDAVKCEACEAVIPAERVELFPNNKLCMTCQQKDERGELGANEVEYCSFCGGIMQTVSVSRGLQRYAMKCSECRR